MFALFRKPTPKKHLHHLNLMPLESRDVPAMWHITMISSNAGDTDATISGSLFVGSADVERITLERLPPPESTRHFRLT